ncbi:MAG: hypothetical protein MNPFHGCM_02437 [Gemmatimonadaceae bacterium]|nr:hypothetical protein [Gemmatimonadaceae bacterium]
MMKNGEHRDAVRLDCEVRRVRKPTHHGAPNPKCSFGKLERGPFNHREGRAHDPRELGAKAEAPRLVPSHRLLNLSGRLRTDDQWEGQP